MNLLERYIFKKAGIATLAVLLSLAGVVWVIQALGQIDVISSKGQTLKAYFMLTTLIIPMLFLAVIPVALLLATVATVNNLNGNSELVVINASGASNRTIVKPFLILALLCSLFTGFVGHYVISWSLTSLKYYTQEMKADLVSIILKEGQFSEVEKGLTFHVANRLPDGRLSGILISDDRDEKQQLMYLAREGLVFRDDSQALLYLTDGEIQQKDKGDNSSSVINYKSYVFDLNSFSAKNEEGNQHPRERTTWDLLNPDPNDSYFKKHPQLFSSQVHQRFSEMLWPFAYVMMILAFCGQARSSRQGYASAIGTGIIVLVVLRGFAFSAASSVKKNEDAAIYLYLIPLAAMVYAAYYLYQNRLVSVPQRLQPVLERSSLALSAKITKWRERYIQYRRGRIPLKAKIDEAGSRP